MKKEHFQERKMMTGTAIFIGPHSGKKKPNNKTSATITAITKTLEVVDYTPTFQEGISEQYNLAEYYKTLLQNKPNQIILLPGWEDNREGLSFLQAAHSLNATVTVYNEDKTFTEITLDDIIAPLLPGYGVIAPDSDLTEMPHEEAARIVLGPRGAYYDTPLRNLGRTALIWSGILGNKLRDDQEITAEDVSMCMVGLKLSRESFRHKRDNITDAHGYLMTLEMIIAERSQQEKDEK